MNKEASKQLCHFLRFYCIMLLETFGGQLTCKLTYGLKISLNGFTTIEL
jgi:hypothetical protein